MLKKTVEAMAETIKNYGVAGGKANLCPYVDIIKKTAPSKTYVCIKIQQK